VKIFIVNHGQQQVNPSIDLLSSLINFSSGKEMTEAWYNEHRKYDYNNGQNYQSGTGHFTQVVWKNSQEVGFARAKGSSMNFTVAMYYPAGNFLGEFDKNVFPSH
jgi:hypothetical protein